MVTETAHLKRLRCLPKSFAPVGSLVLQCIRVLHMHSIRPRTVDCVDIMHGLGHLLIGYYVCV